MYWSDYLEFGLGVFTILVIGVSIIFSVAMITSMPEVKIYNKHNRTNYTAWQWVCSSDTIKDYVNQEGKKQTINLK